MTRSNGGRAVASPPPLIHRRNIVCGKVPDVTVSSMFIPPVSSIIKFPLAVTTLYVSTDVWNELPFFSPGNKFAHAEFLSKYLNIISTALAVFYGP